MFLIKKLFHYSKLFLLLGIISSLINGCTEGDSTNLFESLIVEFNDVQSVSVSALNTIITTGDSLQLVFTATDSQNAEIDLSDSVSWTSSDSGIATIDSSGLLQSFANDGTVTITATLSNFSDSIDITMSSAALTSIEVKADTATPDILSVFCYLIGRWH